MEIYLKDECYKIIGACFEVHKNLGSDFLEAVYAETLTIELRQRQIPCEREKTLHIFYKETLLDKKYIADFICYGTIILELKALSELNTSHEAQVLNYLKATGLKLGLLVNFGESSLKSKRLVK